MGIPKMASSNGAALHWRRAAAFASMGLAVVAIIAFVATAGESTAPVVLATDCSTDPWAPSCHHESFMDMINGIGNRAQSNAIKQKKVKEQLLAQEKLVMKKQEAADRLKAKHEAEKAKEGASTGSSLKDTDYGGLNIASKKSVDSTMAQLLKKGGKAAVLKKVNELREQVLADSGKMFGYGKKAGYLPPPPALKKFK